MQSFFRCARRFESVLGIYQKVDFSLCSSFGGFFLFFFSQGRQLRDFGFVFLNTKPLMKKDIFQKERIYSKGEQILSFKKDIQKGGKKQF